MFIKSKKKFFLSISIIIILIFLKINNIENFSFIKVIDIFNKIDIIEKNSKIVESVNSNNQIEKKSTSIPVIKEIKEDLLKKDFNKKFDNTLNGLNFLNYLKKFIFNNIYLTKDDSIQKTIVPKNKINNTASSVLNTVEIMKSNTTTTTVTPSSIENTSEFINLNAKKSEIENNLNLLKKRNQEYIEYGRSHFFNKNYGEAKKFNKLVKINNEYIDNIEKNILNKNDFTYKLYELSDLFKKKNDQKIFENFFINSKDNKVPTEQLKIKYYIFEKNTIEFKRYNSYFFKKYTTENNFNKQFIDEIDKRDISYRKELGLPTKNNISSISNSILDEIQSNGTTESDKKNIMLTTSIIKNPDITTNSIVLDDVVTEESKSKTDNNNNDDDNDISKK